MPIEIFVEADFVTDFDRIQVNPGFRDMRFHFGLEIAVNPVVQRHRFAVAQVGVGFVAEIFAFFTGGVNAKIG